MAEAEPELEAMKMDDCSWHSCQVYFSPNGASLVIQYESDGSQDILVSEKEALMRIRVRSLPLQEDGCTQIKPGEHVVVNQNSESEMGFFDAEVEQVLRVRHSKRMGCRCSFMIRWLHHDLNGGSLTVPSTSVMRLADRSIDKHPTISAFIDANSTFSGMSPELNVVDDFDLDLQNLLEKQIEGIKNSVHCSKKRIRDEVKGLEANAHEQENETDISLPNVREPEIKFSTGSPLNPLAARAALASLMSKLPQSLEISTGTDDISTITKLSLKTEPAPKLVRNVKKSLFSSNDSSDVSHTVDVSSAVVVSQSGKGHAKSDKMNPEITSRSTRAKSQKAKCFPHENVERSGCVDSKKPSTVTNRRFTRSVLHQEAASIEMETKKESAGDELPTERRNKKRNTEGISLFSTNDSSKMSQDVEVSSVVVVNQSGKGHAKADKMNPEITTGLTRAISQKTEGFPDEKFERSNRVDSKKSSTVTNRRFTRSVHHQEAASIKTETKKELGGEELPTEQRTKVRNTEGISLFSTNNSSEMSQVVEVSSAVVENQSGKRHAKADKMNPEITTVLTCAESQKANGVTDEKCERNCVDSKKPCTVTNRRFTRSVLHQEAASIETETKKELGGEELSAEQRNKKRNTEGTVTSNGESSYGNRKKNSLDLTKHKVLRSSPRFKS